MSHWLSFAIMAVTVSLIFVLGIFIGSETLQGPLVPVLSAVLGGWAGFALKFRWEG